MKCGTNVKCGVWFNDLARAGESALAKKWCVHSHKYIYVCIQSVYFNNIIMATILMLWCICVAINCPYAYTLVKRDLPLRIACMRQLFQHGQLQLFFQLFDRRFFYLSPSLQWKLNEEKFDRKIWYVVTKEASKGPEIWNASELRYSCTISIFPSYNFFPHEKNVRAHFGLKRDHNNNNNEKIWNVTLCKW